MTPDRCTHSFPDPYPQPISQIGDCRDCGITYQEAKEAAARSTRADQLCGQPHYDYPESVCAEPAGHYRRDRDSHAAQLVIGGRECGAVGWDEPTRQTPGGQP